MDNSEFRSSVFTELSRLAESVREINNSIEALDQKIQEVKERLNNINKEDS
jgi:prefoldin subunit 5